MIGHNEQFPGWQGGLKIVFASFLDEFIKDFPVTAPHAVDM